MKRTGVLLAVSSLPTPHGVGDLGQSAMDWIDILAENGVTIWQILPLNPTGYGNSPYQPYSSRAGDELYISLETLAKEGLLTEEFPTEGNESPRVEYEAVRAVKDAWLKKAYDAFTPNAEFEAFAEQEWVRDYCVFRAMKKANSSRCWLEWPKEQRDWPENRRELSPELEAEARYQAFLQYEFLKQWNAVREYAHGKNIQIMGDVPFYVGIDSVDVWAARDNFLLDSEGYPTYIAGVPPDYFSATGQRWGNPIYDWEKLEKDDFAFWVERIGYSQKLFDIIRIDHFRAFDTFWKIPASCPTAIEGNWIEAPGYAVLDTLYEKIPGLQLVAEDLGDLRPEVLTLRDHYHLKGMKVQQFTLNTKSKRVYDREPTRENLILYTGTHDNDTLRGWYDALSTAEKRKLRRWLKQQGCTRGNAVERMTQLVLQSCAEYAILPAQDVMELTNAARMNTPGTVGSPNWEWRLTGFDSVEACLRRLRPLILRRAEEE